MNNAAEIDTIVELLNSSEIVSKMLVGLCVEKVEGRLPFRCRYVIQRRGTGEDSTEWFEYQLASDPFIAIGMWREASARFGTNEVRLQAVPM